MRDLFGIGPETKSRHSELDVLIKEIRDLKQNILDITIQQQKDRELFLELKQQEIEEEIIEVDEEPIIQEEIAQEEPYILLEEPKQQIINRIEEEYRNPLELEAIKSVVKNKKIIIKQKILAIASKQKTTAKQIKEIIVDKYKYCSKATFYRYLSELKRQKRIETISVNNREYVYNIMIENRRQQF